ncbi:hypothetical protein [Flavobacterium gelatinilyticum]|uniref:hypothetical protein n=1 Tax=Flavobacterium gelatinilyticum TaxID=3003260 RepID=UPI0024816278|nr:hypothetical protein [Flavobacterium gelatinilyticum]
MNLLETTIRDKEELYTLAVKYFKNINPEEYENVKFDTIIPKSISVLTDHDFIPTPCIGIKLELHRHDKLYNRCNYFLYVDENIEFVDEFLIFE